MKRNKHALRAGRKNSTYPKKKAFLVRENRRRRERARELGLSSYDHAWGLDYPIDKIPWK